MGDFEIIVVNDGSTDNSLEVIKKYARNEKINIISFEENHGASFARNFGIKASHGEYLMIWDSDDILHPQALERLNKVFIEKPQYGIVSAPARQELPSGKTVPYLIKPDGELNICDIICRNIPGNEKIRMVRRELFDDIEYESKNIDFMVNCFLVAKARWYHLQEELGVVFLESDVNSLTLKRKVPDPIRSIEHVHFFKRFLERFGKKMEGNCPKIFQAYNYGLLVGLILSGDKDGVRKVSRRMFSTGYLKVRHFLMIILGRLPFSRAILHSLFFLKKNLLKILKVLKNIYNLLILKKKNITSTKRTNSEIKIV
jgi:glycosyltransferase involved in cell wall biosynthesis